jgi:hypothetical protein
MASEDFTAANLNRLVLWHRHQLCPDQLVEIVGGRNLGEPLDDIEFVAAGVEMDFVVVHDDGDGASTFIVMPVMAVVMALVVAVFTTALLKFQHKLFSCRMLRRLMSRRPFG